MFIGSALTALALPSGLFILVGFFSLIVLAMFMWNSPGRSNENPDALKPETGDQAKPVD